MKYLNCLSVERPPLFITFLLGIDLFAEVGTGSLFRSRMLRLFCFVCHGTGSDKGIRLVSDAGSDSVLAALICLCLPSPACISTRGQFVPQ